MCLWQTHHLFFHQIKDSKLVEARETRRLMAGGKASVMARWAWEPAIFSITCHNKHFDASLFADSDLGRVLTDCSCPTALSSFWWYSGDTSLALGSSRNVTHQINQNYYNNKSYSNGCPFYIIAFLYSDIVAHVTKSLHSSSHGKWIPVLIICRAYNFDRACAHLSHWMRCHVWLAAYLEQFKWELRTGSTKCKLWLQQQWREKLKNAQNQRRIIRINSSSFREHTCCTESTHCNSSSKNEWLLVVLFKSNENIKFFRRSHVLIASSMTQYRIGWTSKRTIRPSQAAHINLPHRD